MSSVAVTTERVTTNHEDRVYASGPRGAHLGYLDITTGVIHLRDTAHRELAAIALADWQRHLSR